MLGSGRAFLEFMFLALELASIWDEVSLMLDSVDSLMDDAGYLILPDPLSASNEGWMQPGQRSVEVVFLCLFLSRRHSGRREM